MSLYHARHITSLDDHQIDSAAWVMVAAYDGDPLLPAMVGGDTSLSHSLFKAYIAATIVEGDAYFVQSDAGQVIAVALWFGPGRGFLESREQREAGWVEYWDKLNPDAQEWQDDEFIPQLASLYSYSLPEDLSNTDIYRLICLCVLPIFQRKGIGRMLIEEGKERARQKRAPIYADTATDSGVAIFRRWGLRISAATVIRSMWMDFVMTVVTWIPDS